MTRELRPATREVFELAEGPVWDAPRQRLLWVDILAGAVWAGRLDDDGTIEATRLLVLDETVGAVAAGADGSLIVAGQERLHHVDVDGTVAPGARVVPTGAGRRCNDGGVDPVGRFLVGTMPLRGSSTRETLVRLDPDGALGVLDDGLTLSNGLAWSLDGRRLFHVDTARRTVWSRDYDVASGEVGPREPHLVLTRGAPDGIALDAEDHLWLAVWGGGRVQRYAPSGALVAELALPAPDVTSVAFAGPELSTLVVTSARSRLDDRTGSDVPGSGRLFTTRVDVPGAPVPPWRATPWPGAASMTDPQERQDP
jgi:sugar lactone lactonase YvrE